MDQESASIDRQTRFDIARYFTADIGYRIGQQISFLTLTWLTYSLAKSSTALGFLAFCYNIPFLFLSPIAGMISDRRSRKLVLMIGYGAQALIAAGLVTAELSGTLTLPMIFGGALLVGIFATITAPSVVVILKDFIKEDDLFGRLSGVAAANTKIGQLIASAGFGFLYGLITATGTLLLSGIMALVSYISISGIKIISEEHPKLAPGQTVAAFAMDGRRYVFRHRAMALLVMLTAVPMAARGMIFYQLPAIVDRQFSSGHLTMGIIYAVGVVGGLIGGIILGRRKNARGIIRWSIVAAGMTSVSLIGVYFAERAFVAAIAVAVLDMAFVFSTGIGNAALQTMSDNDHRGRVMGFLQMCVYGFLAVFSLASGILADFIGLPILIFGTAVAVAAVMIAYILSIPWQREDLDALYAAQNVKPENRPL